MEVIQKELPELSGNVTQAYKTHRSSGRVQEVLYPYPGYCGTSRTELTEVPGTGMNYYRSSGYGYELLQKFQKFPRIVARAYRTYRYSGYGYECPTDLIKVLCVVIPGVNTPGMVLCVPNGQHASRKFACGYECRTELTYVPRTGRVVQNSQKLRIRVIYG